MNRKLLLLFLCLGFLKARTQNTIALPEIISYSKQAYSAGTQNWKIAQDKNGIMYFANNEGLLTFDGSYWKKYCLPNETIIRSVAVGKDERIYIGAQNEIGYFAAAKNGRLQYTSLNSLIPADEKDFADVWNVIPYEDQVFFRSNRRIFQLNNGKIIAYRSADWGFLGFSNGQLIAKEYERGLLTFQKGRWVSFLQKNAVPKGARITSFTAINKDSSLLTTLSHGLYILHQDQLNLFESADLKLIAGKNVYGSVMIDTNRIALITNLAGCFILSQKGELIQRLSKQDGLQTNNILSIFLDRGKNLWLGLDNGIDFVVYNNAIKHIYPDYQEHGAGYTSIVFNNDLYIGTANGLYRAPLTSNVDLSFVKSSFDFVPGTKGQVWNLSEVNGRLLMGHNVGFFLIDGKTAQLVDGSSGFWTFLPLSNVLPATVIAAGTYNGINFYNYEKGHFVSHTVHTHFESARFVAMDNNIAWVAHPYKGLYKIQLNGGIKPGNILYRDTKKILSQNHNHLYKIKGRIVLTTDKGLFEYNVQSDDFEPSDLLNKIFKRLPVQYLKEDDKGNIWFVSNKRLGVADFSGANPKLIFIPELNNKIMTNGYESVYPFNNKNVFIAGEQGFYHINYEQYKTHKETVPILISGVKAINKKDSSIFGGYFSGDDAAENFVNKEIPELSPSWNSIHFSYSSPLYGQQPSLQYSYYLEDFDKSWSSWSQKTEKEYSYLPPGTYTFKVKARRHEGEESRVYSYRFTILPPWYRTIGACIIYLLAVASLIYTAYKWQKRKFIRQSQKHEEERKRLQYLHQLELEKHEEEQKQLLYLHQLERERNEKEIIRLQNEKLEAEIQLKNTELASTTLNLIQKGDMLIKVKEEFVRMKKNGEADKDSDDYKKIIRMLGEDKLKKNWEEFAVHFDKVHSDFLVSLKSRYPNLTPSELKLCAYLRLNLSSKEIAQIMNITIKSVELGRYRLRKKLQIAPEMNLFNFLLNFRDANKTA
jgi:hypothetical protein